MLIAAGQVVGWVVFVGTLIFPFHNQITSLFREPTTTPIVAEIKTEQVVEKKVVKEEPRVIERIIERVIEVPVEKLVQVQSTPVVVPQTTVTPPQVVAPVVQTPMAPEPIKEEPIPTTLQIQPSVTVSVDGGSCGRVWVPVFVKDQFGNMANAQELWFNNPETGEVTRATTFINKNGSIEQAYSYSPKATSTQQTIHFGMDNPELHGTYTVNIIDSWYDQMSKGKRSYHIEKTKKGDIWVDGASANSVDPTTGLCL